MEQRISRPPDKHDCRNHLPWRGGGYGSTGEPDGTVALCRVCDRAWVSLPCFESYGPVTWWRPVHWFSRPDIRRRARALQEAS